MVHVSAWYRPAKLLHHFRGVRLKALSSTLGLETPGLPSTGHLLRFSRQVEALRGWTLQIWLLWVDHKICSTTNSAVEMLGTREILRVHIRISSWPSQSSSQQWRLPFIPQFRSRSQTCMRAGPAPHRVRWVFKKSQLLLFSNPGLSSCCIFTFFLILPDVYGQSLVRVARVWSQMRIFCTSTRRSRSTAMAWWRSSSGVPHTQPETKHWAQHIEQKYHKKHYRIVFKLPVGLCFTCLPVKWIVSLLDGSKMELWVQRKGPRGMAAEVKVRNVLKMSAC